MKCEAWFLGNNYVADYIGMRPGHRGRMTITSGATGRSFPEQSGPTRRKTGLGIAGRKPHRTPMFPRQMPATMGVPSREPTCLFWLRDLQKLEMRLRQYPVFGIFVPPQSSLRDMLV